MACIDIDVDDYLNEASVPALVVEVARRVANGEWRSEHSKRLASRSPDHAEVWTRDGLADDLRTAFYARNASRFEALLVVLDPNARVREPES
jgi:hypothetical protein